MRTSQGKRGGREPTLNLSSHLHTMDEVIDVGLTVMQTQLWKFKPSRTICSAQADTTSLAGAPRINSQKLRPVFLLQSKEPHSHSAS